MHSVRELCVNEKIALKWYFWKLSENKMPQISSAETCYLDLKTTGCRLFLQGMSTRQTVWMFMK
jgi:hypothetical protein